MQPAFDQKVHLDPQVSNHDDTLSGTTAANGDSVDCREYNGPVYALAHVGAATGSPTSFTVTAKLQESDDGSTGWTDLANQDTAVLTADNSSKYVRGHRTKRYCRVVLTPAFVGGSSPTVPGAGSVITGQMQRA